MDNCPNCKVSFIGDPIPNNINHHYHGKYWRREIVINVRGIYDGAVAIRCPDCGHEFPRNNSSLALEMFTKYKGKWS